MNKWGTKIYLYGAWRSLVARVLWEHDLRQAVVLLWLGFFNVKLSLRAMAGDKNHVDTGASDSEGAYKALALFNTATMAYFSANLPLLVASIV